MNKSQKTLTERVEDTMGSLDNIQRADPGPWFYGRLSARLANGRSAWYAVGAFLSRPAVAFSAILGVLVLNVFLLAGEESSGSATAGNQQGVVTENEYITATNSSFEFENVAQP